MSKRRIGHYKDKDSSSIRQIRSMLKPAYKRIFNKYPDVYTGWYCSDAEKCFQFGPYNYLVIDNSIVLFTTSDHTDKCVLCAFWFPEKENSTVKPVFDQDPILIYDRISMDTGIGLQDAVKSAVMAMSEVVLYKDVLNYSGSPVWEGVTRSYKDFDEFYRQIAHMNISNLVKGMSGLEALDMLTRIQRPPE